MNEFNPNQSSFAESSPLSQPVDHVLPSQASNTQSTGSSSPQDQPLPKEPFYKGKNAKFILLGIPVALVLILFTAVQIQNARRASSPEITPAPTSVQETPSVNRTPIQERIDRLESELQAAEPTQQDLAFPPVSDSISLE